MATVTVKAGQTLSGIAKKQGVPLGVLIDANGITDPNKIKVGQILIIPSTTTDGMDHPTEPSIVTAPPAGFAINQKKFRLPPNCYKQEVFEKDLILLHYTAGSTAKSAYDTWVSAANQVATAYIVDVDGTIYETFDPKFWAYHLGVSNGGKHTDHKRSIGIEIVNVGVLRPDAANANQLNWWPPSDPVTKQALFRTKYCTTAQPAKYVTRAFRGFNFHASFPEVQITQVGLLVRHLCDTFQISRRLPALAQREEFNLPYAGGFKGIISHQSFRPDKFDVGPAFDWSKVL